MSQPLRNVQFPHRIIAAATLVVAVFFAAMLALPQAVEAETTYTNMYRLYNPNSGEHFYTASLAEAKSVVEAGWQWEGVGWVAPKTSKTPVYRLYSGADHHYTASVEERDWLIDQGWKSEGIGWYSDDAKGVALLRQFNPNVDPSAATNNSGSHNYTTSKAENDHLVSVGWRAEGIGWYGAKVATQPISGFWVTTSAWGNGSQLYWIGSDAQLAKGRYVDPSTSTDAGAGFVAYATNSGAIVRGVYQIDETHVIVASAQGRVAYGVKDGWLTTDAYADNSQTYYFEGNKARVGEFTVSGTTYYARADQGYLMRSGTYTDPQAGYTYTTNAEGVVISKVEESLGDLVARVAVACAGTADPDDAIKNTGGNAPWSKISDARLSTWFSIADATLGAFGGNTAYSSCAQAVAGVLGATVDPDIAGNLKGKDSVAMPSSGPGTVWSYIKEHPEVYQKVTSADDIQPGDVICSDYHIAIYVGNKAARKKFATTAATVYQASYPDNFPALDNWPKDYIYSRFGGEVYHVVAKNVDPVYPYIDYESLL